MKLLIFVLSLLVSVSTFAESKKEKKADPKKAFQEIILEGQAARELMNRIDLVEGVVHEPKGASMRHSRLGGIECMYVSGALGHTAGGVSADVIECHIKP